MPLPETTTDTQRPREEIVLEDPLEEPVSAVVATTQTHPEPLPVSLSEVKQDKTVKQEVADSPPLVEVLEDVFSGLTIENDAHPNVKIGRHGTSKTPVTITKKTNIYTNEVEEYTLSLSGFDYREARENWDPENKDKDMDTGDVLGFFKPSVRTKLEIILTVSAEKPEGLEVTDVEIFDETIGLSTKVWTQRPENLNILILDYYPQLAYPSILSEILEAVEPMPVKKEEEKRPERPIREAATRSDQRSYEKKEREKRNLSGREKDREREWERRDSGRNNGFGKKRGSGKGRRKLRRRDREKEWSTRRY